MPMANIPHHPHRSPEKYPLLHLSNGSRTSAGCLSVIAQKAGFVGNRQGRLEILCASLHFQSITRHATSMKVLNIENVTENDIGLCRWRNLAGKVTPQFSIELTFLITGAILCVGCVLTSDCFQAMDNDIHD
jgi:hypothetical protein